MFVIHIIFLWVTKITQFSEAQSGHTKMIFQTMAIKTGHDREIQIGQEFLL